MCAAYVLGVPGIQGYPGSPGEKGDTGNKVIRCWNSSKV